MFYDIKYLFNNHILNILYQDIHLKPVFNVYNKNLLSYFF